MTAILVIHIAFGVAALIGAAFALTYPKGSPRHVAAGRVYVAAMTGIFLTALMMAYAKSLTFLFFIAVFSFYLALTGWLHARNHSGTANRAEWLCAGLMLLTTLGMLLFGLHLRQTGDGLGTVLLVFAGIGAALSLTDAYFLRQKAYVGARRIAAHLTKMLAGTIAVITAVLVVNVEFEPEWVVWLAPTVLITPLIVYWRIRTLRPAGLARA